MIGPDPSHGHRHQAVAVTCRVVTVGVGTRSLSPVTWWEILRNRERSFVNFRNAILRQMPLSDQGVQTLPQHRICFLWNSRCEMAC